MGRGEFDRRAMLHRFGTAAVGGALFGAVAPAAQARALAGDQEARSPQQALRALKEGNARFVSGRLRHPGQDPARRRALAHHQDPFAVVFSCIDSRVPPEIVFDRGLGDLFVIRTAAQLSDDLTLGSAEYGPVTHGTPLIVVMGHQRCGAVIAAVESLERHEPLPPHLDTIVRLLRPAYEAARRIGGPDLVDLTIRINTRMVVEALRTDEALKCAVASGDLVVEAAYYSLDTGRVSWLG